MAVIVPKELTHDMPYMTLIGDSSLYIEHHHGMISYCPEKIIFDTGIGLLTIAGRNLIVERYTAAEAGLTGKIDTVTVHESER